jgi:hypothetical protein
MNWRTLVRNTEVTIVAISDEPGADDLMMDEMEMTASRPQQRALRSK